MLRRIVLLISIFVAIVLVAALAALVLIDPDDYRDQIASRASDQLGREVRLAGPIELRLFPWLAFEISDASVANPPDFDPAPPLAEIGLARASIRLWPLIRGEIEIGTIELENATLALVTAADGRSNLDGLFAADPELDRPERAETDLSTLRTGAIGLRNITLVMIDLARDERQEISIESLDLSPFAAERNVSLALQGRVASADEILVDNLRFDGTLRVPADLAHLDLADWQARFALPAAAATIRGGGELRLDLAREPLLAEMQRLDLEISLPDMALGLVLTEPLALQLGEPVRLDLPGAELSIDGQRLSVSGTLSSLDPLAGQMEISGQRLDLRGFAAGDGDDAGTHEPAGFDFALLEPIDFRLALALEELLLPDDLSLHALRTRAHLRRGELDVAQVSAAFRKSDDQLVGQISGNLRARLSAEAIDVVVPGLDLDLSMADLALGLAVVEPLSIRLADPVAVSLPAIHVVLDEDRLAVAGELVLGDPIRGRLEISGERLDLDRLAALAGAADDDVQRTDEPDFAPLRQLDFQAGLRLDELVLVEDVRLTAVQARAHLVEGILILQPLDAQLFGGRFDGTASVDFNAEPPFVHLQPRLSGVLVEQIVGLFVEHEAVVGSGDLSLDLRFQGLDLTAILATLDGSGNFALSDGAVHGIDFNRLIEQKLTAASLVNVREVFGGQTPFRRLSGNLQAAEGVLTLPDLALEAAGYAASGSGLIDLRQARVDYQLELNLGEELTRRMPRALQTATGGRIPLAVAGPIAAPVVSVDLASIAERALREEVGRRLLERLDRPPEPVEQQEPPPASESDEPADEAHREEDRSERSSRQLLRGLLESRERRPTPPEELDRPENDDEEVDPEVDPENARDADPGQENHDPALKLAAGI